MDRFRLFNKRGLGYLAAASVLVVSGALMLAGPASAAEKLTISPEAETTIRAQMSEVGITDALQVKLIKKLEGGKALDSMGGESPTRTFVEQRDGATRSVSVFKDGSRSWTEVQTAVPVEGAATNRLDSCVYSAQWFVNCRVIKSDTVSNAQFRIDYQHVAPNPARVRDYRGASCFNLLGTCSVSGGIVRSVQSSAGPAWARMTYKAQILNVPSVAGEIGIRVSGNVATSYGD